MKMRSVVLSSALMLGTAIVPLSSVTHPQPALAATAATGFDGNPATTERLAEGHPTFAAADISKARFADAAAPGRHATRVVLSRDDTFADSVAGSALTGPGPLLLTATGSLSPATSTEISRVLAPGGTVFLLGGPNAISTNVESQMQGRGYLVRRLSGATRVETAVAIADAVRAERPGDDVMIARAWGPSGNDTAAWADSVSGGAFAAASGIPILVTPSHEVAAPVAAWLARDTPLRTTLLGGEAALSAAVASKVPGPRRVSGAERTATAAAIATQLWGVRTDGAQRFLLTNAASDVGWTYGFSAAGMAADAHAPVLLVTTAVTDATTNMVRTCGPPRVDMLVVGDGTVIPAPMREQLDAADGHACGPGGAVVYPTDLTEFPDCASALSYFQQAALERVGPYGLGGTGDARSGGFGAPPPTALAPVGAAPGDGAAGGGTTESGTSSTNVQEEGVDEPDIVKTDGHHLFSVSAGELRIVRIDQGPPTLVARMTLPGEGMHELLLSGTRLVVMTRSFQYIAMEGPPVAGGGGGGTVEGSPGVASFQSIIAPIPSPSRTTLTAIDISNPAQPRTESSLEIEGDYQSARLVGTAAHIVVQTNPEPMPFVYPSQQGKDAEQAAAAENRQLILSSTLDDWLPGFSRLDGNGQVLEHAPLVACGDVHKPPLFSGLGTLSVVTLDLSQAFRPSTTAAVVAAGETVYASPTRVVISTSRWGWEPDALDSGVTTEVHSFDTSSPTVTRYAGSGAVPGYILNQFAISEHGGNLRVATTSQPPWQGDVAPGETDNGVHVLAEQAGGKLGVIGRVTGLGKGERIFGVRFFGDLGTVVTFRQIDPLFLIDLSSPTAPRVTGERKLPGFSAYLHRVGPNHILGVGSDATTDGRIIGAQVSLFDISNRAAPSLAANVKYPNGGSIVAYDHHAFLHWPATGLAVVPLYEQGSSPDSFFSGAVGLVVGTGLTTAGRASHVEEATGGDPQITRSVVANNTLFTISDAGVEANDLSTLAKQSFLNLA